MGLEDDGPNVKKEERIVVYQHINAPTDSLLTRRKNVVVEFRPRTTFSFVGRTKQKMIERHRKKKKGKSFGFWTFLVLRLSVGSDRWRGDKSSVIFI